MFYETQWGTGLVWACDSTSAFAGELVGDAGIVDALEAVLMLDCDDFVVQAALVSMFFPLSYGLLNYATYVEARAASPSFRPRFREKAEPRVSETA
jgi:hypothetical protein